MDKVDKVDIHVKRRKMPHGEVREGWFVISASVPLSLVRRVDDLGERLGHDTRSETLRLILSRYFEERP